MIASAVEPTTAPTTLAGDLLLARLLPPTKRPPGPSKVRDDVSHFFRERPSDDRWQETIDGLINGALLTTRPMRLTDAGRACALEFLAVGELPPRSTWATIQAKFLVPKALGLAAAPEEQRKRIEKPDGLAALLLRRRYDVQVTANATLMAVVSALLGLAAKRSGIAALRSLVLEGWADGAAPRPAAVPQLEPRPIAPPPDALEPVEFDLPAFAQTVKAAARDCPTGRFGDNKVFISHVWRRLRDEPGFPAMDLPTFRERLTEANNAGLLTLSRADLVQLMDPADVQESLTRYLNAEFHFILLEKEQP